MDVTQAPVQGQEELYWVGIGASAGGLEAIKLLTQALPSNTNLVYIVAQHLSPKHKSMLTELIQRNVQLKVETVTDNIQARPNTIYITPPQKNVKVEGEHLRLTDASEESFPKPSINKLFISLAEEKKDRAIGIILSGTGSDGAHGIKMIRACGGLTIAQAPESAQYDGMPRAAIETDCVDFVLSPHEIGHQLEKVSSQLPAQTRLMLEKLEVKDSFSELINLVRQQCGVSFKDYKKATLQRRIERRMLSRGIDDFAKYVAFAREHSEEVRLLFKDILISVTEFFRDWAPFEALAKVISDIVLEKKGQGPLRFWCVGCATGEEAYSLAILLAEAVGGPEKLAEKNFQIFATDVDADALAVARKGSYPEASVVGIPAKYLSKYFIKHDKNYRVVKPVKDAVLFANHNIIEDPPFLRLDLISCRNLLIYMEPELQKQIFNVFHYSLLPKGHLLLGKSESISQVAPLFHSLDSKQKIFQRRGGANYSAGINFFSGRSKHIPRFIEKQEQGKERKVLPNLHEALVLQLGDASFLINDNFDIEHVYGDATPYITLGNGKPALNLTNLINEVHRQEVRALVFKAFRTHDTVSGQPRKIKIDGKLYQDRLKIYPLQSEEGTERYALVCIERLGKIKKEHEEDSGEASHEKIRELEGELTTAREHLQTVIEELETSNEELQSLNEELQSSNEELQSSNEELETTNEELQSANEELITINDELNNKTLAVEQTSNQLLDIINSLNFPIIVINDAMKVLRFNESSTRVFELSNADMVLTDMIPEELESMEIPRIVHSVIKGAREKTLQLEFNECHYWLQITPYAPQSNAPSGAILSFIENTELINQKKDLEASQKMAQAANIAKSDFLANVSHEIRTPLNAIYGVMEIFKLRLPDRKKQEELLSVLESSAVNLKQLLDDLLDFSKLEAKQLKLESVDFSLRELLDKIYSVYSLQTSQKNIALKLHIETSLPDSYIGDPLRIYQIVANLLSNAVKFTEEGEVCIQIAAERNGGALWLVLMVEDSGIGMDESEVRIIFDKFSQSDASITRRYGGTGLGLAIVKQLVQLMDGNISVESEKGKGTRFIVRLPMHVSEEASRGKSSKARAKPIFNSREQAEEAPILIVEDNRSNIYILSSFLDELGCVYDVAESGEEGLQLAQKKSYKCILLDLQMENMDGFQFFSHLRGRGYFSSETPPRVIAISGNVQASVIERVRKYGMDGFLAKPLELDVLWESLTKHLNKEYT